MKSADFLGIRLRIRLTIWCSVLAALSVFWGCGAGEKQSDLGAVVYSIEGKGGAVARFSSNGARLVSLSVPGRDGKLVDVVVGFENVTDYNTATEPYFGATIGRYGNRIAGGRFSLDGKSYKLTVNNGPNTLHGGKTGFQYQMWDLKKRDDSTLVCSLVSPDGDNGFPGKLSVQVVYTLRADNSLEMSYTAETDQPTVVNLTNHAFFNLNGSGSILGHSLRISSDRFLPVDSTLIPTGELRLVAGTPFDFREAALIGDRIDAAEEQLAFGKGYDHNFVLSGRMGEKRLAAVALGDKSGIRMEVFTTEPGLQFYSGNFMQGNNRLRTGLDDFRTAFCLETQHFPDSPNQPAFPSTVLRPGEKYTSWSSYRFSVVE
jgi:aldose 1-epimerase